MKIKEWEDLLSKLISREDFRGSITKHGFYLSPQYNTFRAYVKKEWNITSTANTATLLSLDFWSRQPQILTQNGYYLIRTGEGSFAILQEEQFPKPYLNLQINNPITIEIQESDGFDHLKQAFNENILENTALEQLRFNHTLEKLVFGITGKREEFFVGPRGNTTRTFNVYLKNRLGELVKIRQYVGMAELDYTVWTKNSVLLFEAKKSDSEIPLDIGWHKIAYPSVRFMAYKDLQIYPLYLIRLKDQIIVFSFPIMKFFDNGVILNDKNQITPNKTFVISLR